MLKFVMFLVIVQLGAAVVPMDACDLMAGDAENLQRACYTEESLQKKCDEADALVANKGEALKRASNHCVRACIQEAQKEEEMDDMQAMLSGDNATVLACREAWEAAKARYEDTQSVWKRAYEEYTDAVAEKEKAEKINMVFMLKKRGVWDFLLREGKEKEDISV